MRILSWNVNRNNRRLGHGLSRLAMLDYDVICLQEFPASRLSLLSSLFPAYWITTAKEFFIHKKPHKSRKLYLVILSRVAVLDDQVVKHEKLRRTPLRYRLFFSDVDISYHYVDILTDDDRRFRIFNCHLECVASPSVRMERMYDIINNFDPDATNIVCGDFNAFSNSFVSLCVWWLFGNYSFRDFFVNERRQFRIIFETHQLNNVIDGRKTFVIFPMQLDYILVPKDVAVQQSQVLRRRFGSDHRPIQIEI